MKKSLFIALVFLNGTALFAQSIALIPQGSTWKYLDNGSNQATAWRSSSFNDAAWASGNAELGYGDGGEATIVSYGPNASNKYRTTYLRKTFNVANPSLYSTFTLNLKRDDGAVVYLNGVEVVRSNMPTGTITYTTLASSAVNGASESTFYPFTLNPSSFITGNNVLAVEIHQSSAGSSDISFDLKLDATLTGCGVSTVLAATSITSSTASISWGAVTGATSYNVQYRIVGSTVWSIISTAATSTVLTGLVPASIYEYQVQAVCSVNGLFSSSANFTTLAAGTDTLIKTNSSWKYLDNGTNQGTGWRAKSFNDGSWASGNAELGYGDGGEATLVSYGSSSTNKYITTYFRKSFTVTNPAVYASLTLGIVRDDGVVVYINGTEVYRNNMPTGTIAYNTLAPAAIGGTDESAWYAASLSTSLLVSGINVIAVEMHQQAISSSDVSFNARLYTSATPATPQVVRGAYLQKLTPNGITIRWRTDIACDSKVNFGTSLQYGSSVTDAAITTEHSVTLNGLSAATNYFYSIGTSTQILQGDVKNNFNTAPVVGSTSPVRIWATGDFGNGSTQQTAARNAYVNYTGSTPTNLWLWLGDNAYNSGTDVEYQNYVFTKYPDQLKSFPLFPAPGNHDYANVGYQSTSALTTNFPYYSIFSVPQAAEAGGVASGTPKYYSFNYANIHFISLDSYGALNNTSSPMYTWLNNDLAANTQRWTVVYFHHPPYSHGTHNSDTETELINMRTNIVPLLESYHVDLVLCGHSHTNERSYLIKGHFGLANSFTNAMKVSANTNAFTKTAPFDGTVYAVCGTSGQAPGAFQTSGFMPCMFFNDNTNNCTLVLDVNADNFSAKYLASTGTVVDQFSITKTGQRVAAPLNTSVNSFSISLGSNEATATYFLSEDAIVKLELLNALGEKIDSFHAIPEMQAKGYYQYVLPFSENSIGNGIYFIRMFTNGVPTVKKIMFLR